MLYTMLYTTDHDYLIIGWDEVTKEYQASLVRTGWNPHHLYSVNFKFVGPVDRKIVPLMFVRHYWSRKSFKVTFPLGFESSRNSYLIRKGFKVFDLFDGSHTAFIESLTKTGFEFSFFKRSIDEGNYDTEQNYLLFGPNTKRVGNLFLNTMRNKGVNYYYVSSWRNQTEEVFGVNHFVVEVDELNEEFIKWCSSFVREGCYYIFLVLQQDYTSIERNIHIFNKDFSVLKC